MIGSPEEFIWSRRFLPEYKALLDEGSLDTSCRPFVQELREVLLSEDAKSRLGAAVGRRLRRGSRHGHGYLSASSRIDRPSELICASYVAECFQGKFQPVIVSIDRFYRFVPENPSLVMKTQIFDHVAQEQNKERAFAIILTDFSGSQIFTQEILERVPTSSNAGFNFYESSPCAKKLSYFARRQLPLLMQEVKGDLNGVLRKLIETQGAQEEDAKLLLVTGLFLQDIQTWQALWHYGPEEGTPLYIVASMSFHSAMNRFNSDTLDYQYRASNALGAEEVPPLEDGVEVPPHHEGGLSLNEFQRRVKPILDQLEINFPER